MTSRYDDGLRMGARRGQVAAKQPDCPDGTASLPIRASLAYAMRAVGTDHRVVHRVAGLDADQCAVVVEGFGQALDHLARHGLVGTEPPEVTSMRRLSRRWSA